MLLTGALLGALVLGFLLGLLALAVWSYRRGAAISTMLTAVWNREPYVILVFSMLGCFAAGFLFGHWFACPRVGLP